MPEFFERAAGESQLTPGSRLPSPFPVEPGDSESAQPAASRPQDEARTNTTAGSGGGVPVAPELTISEYEDYEFSAWVSAPGRREHNALAFLRRSWSADHVIVQPEYNASGVCTAKRGYWVRLVTKPSELKWRMA